MNDELIFVIVAHNVNDEMGVPVAIIDFDLTGAAKMVSFHRTRICNVLDPMAVVNKTSTRRGYIGWVYLKIALSVIRNCRHIENYAIRLAVAGGCGTATRITTLLLYAGRS